MLTHGQLNAHTAAHAELVYYRSADKTLVCLGLASNFAFSHQMLAAAWAGATLDIIPKFEAELVLEAIQNRGTTLRQDQ